ncbi:MAG: 5'-methylthioadenosine/adenosylhomocysteine nucleosidase [bacterium]|nr:5'-methylthioadenosine/adenosylhomocysteine nucleosidase [bacterium]
MIGIIGAMKVEVDGIVALISNSKEKKIAKRTFFQGFIGNTEVVVVECGVGKVNAGVTTSIMCDNFDVSLIINTGVAGGVDNIKPLDLVIGNDLVYHDFDITPLGYKKGVIPGDGKIFKTNDLVRDMCIEIAKKKNISYEVGNIASGDIFATKKDIIKDLEMDILAIEMEGAAIAHTCKMYDKPFIALRVISDVLESTNQAVSFNEVEKEAAEKALMFVCEIIKKIAIDKKNNNIV